MKGLNNIPGAKNTNKTPTTKESSAAFRPPSYQSQVVPLSKFEGNLESALQFYTGQVAKLTLENNVLNNNLRLALKQKKELADYIAKLESNEPEQSEQKKKRIRRCANQIQRSFMCPANKCGKSYGTQASLAQHIKYKHPELNNGESESKQKEIRQQDSSKQQQPVPTDKQS